MRLYSLALLVSLSLLFTSGSTRAASVTFHVDPVSATAYEVSIESDVALSYFNFGFVNATGFQSTLPWSQLWGTQQYDVSAGIRTGCGPSGCTTGSISWYDNGVAENAIYLQATPTPWNLAPSSYGIGNPLSVGIFETEAGADVGLTFVGVDELYGADVDAPLQEWFAMGSSGGGDVISIDDITLELTSDDLELIALPEPVRTRPSSSSYTPTVYSGSSYTPTVLSGPSGRQSRPSTAVPEPGAIACFGAGLLVAGLRLKSRRG